MAYTTGDGTYHDRRRCRRLHRTRNRITRVDETADLEPCDRCVDDDPIDALIEAGVCPWCPDDGDGYEGEYVGQHASSQHPDAWAAYRGAE